MSILSRLQTLSPVEAGPWWASRLYVYEKMREMGVKEGDIICRRGNAFAYGILPVSDFICSVTQSKYSHAALVIDSKDLLLADVNITGLRRQFVTDWCDDVRGDDICVLRYKGDTGVIRLAVENAKQVLALDPQLDWESDESDVARNFYCTELVCWCYLRAGIMLCEDIPIWRLPGWRSIYNPIAKLHGIDYTSPVWCVGNDKIGLLSSAHLENIGTIGFSKAKRRRLHMSHSFSGA